MLRSMLPYLLMLHLGGCAGVRLHQEAIAPSARLYSMSSDDVWDRIAGYITASGLGIRYEDRAQGLLVTDYVYERNALGLISARFRHYYRIHIQPDGNGSRVTLEVVSEEDAETNGRWRDITAPAKAEALANVLWEVLDPLLSQS